MIPGGASVRAGYRQAPLQFQPADLQIAINREIYSVGLGWMIGNTVNIDIAYRTASWETLLNSTRESWENGQFLMSFGYRF